MTETQAPAEIIGYHFADATLRDGRPLPRAGEALTHDGEVSPCRSGLHASVRAIDALQYATGEMVARVRLSGTVVPHDKDKYAASERTNLTDYVDATRTLHEFACWCATQALDREDAAGHKVDPRSRAAIACKLAWLDGKATDSDLDAAWDAAWAAAWAAADAARDAAWAAARAAAGAADAALDAARDAAWGAAWDAADAARAAARAAAGAAWDAARDAQNEMLERMLTETFERNTIPHV